MLTRHIGIAAFVLLCLPISSKAQVPPLFSLARPTITELGRASDLVAFAIIDEILQPGGRTSPEISVRLRVTRVLKGPPLSEAVASIKSQSPRGPGASDMSPEWVGKSGIWFLRRTGNHFEIFPRDRIDYQAKDLFLPVSDISPPDPVSLDHQLLLYLLRWFQQLQQPTSGDVTYFAPSFERLKGEEALAYLKPLLNSTAQHTLAFTICLRAGSNEALEIFIREVPTLSKDAKFGDLLSAIGEKSQPAWVEPLQRLMALHRDVPGIEDAANSALLRTFSGTKNALPVAVRMLDSNNSGMVLAASGFLANFARFADAKGNPRDSGSNGPFFSAEVEAHRPIVSRQLALEEYRTFWKTWWSENQPKIMGTTAP